MTLVGLEHLLCLELVFIMYGNLSLSKLCRKNPIRSVVSWYKMSFMVYFEFWFGRKFPVKGAKSGHFCSQPDTFMLRRRSLRLGEPKARISTLSGLPRRTSPPRCSIAAPRRTCKLYFGSSLPLILTIVHWINEDPNK